MLLKLSISSSEAYLRCIYTDVPSSNGEMKDLGLHAEIMECAMAVHLLLITMDFYLSEQTAVLSVADFPEPMA